MSQCIAADASTGVLSISSASPCTSLVALTPAEYGALVNSPLNLDASDGFALSVAIIACWAAAFGWKAVQKALDTSD